MHQMTRLANGLRVITAELPTAPSATATLVVGVGARDEPPELSGVSHFLEHLVFKGTRKRPSAQAVTRTIDAVGGYLNAWTSKELTAFWAKTAARHFPLALDVVADLVLNPLLDPEETVRERGVIDAERRDYHDNPHALVGLQLESLLYQGSPLGREVIGEQATILAMTADKLREHRDRWYGPTNAALCAAGRISHEEVVRLAEEMLGDWRAEPERPRREPPILNGETRVALASRLKDAQAQIALALPCGSLRDPDRYVFDVMAAVLGGGMSSRLFTEVRERRGLAYSVHASMHLHSDAGALTVRAGVGPDKAEEALRVILGELERISREPVPADEFEKAKGYLIGHTLLALEDSAAVAPWLGRQEMLLGYIRTLDEIQAAIDAVTPEQVLEMARRYLRPERARLSVVGPFEDAARFEALIAA